MTVTLNRRTFLGVSAAMIAAGAPRAQNAKRRVCIIGDTKQGGYGHSLHLAWAYRDDVEVVALADPDEAGRAKNAAEAKAPRTYADYREMLEKEKPDIVTVGPRWTIHHKEYLDAAAAIGAHGFMEKPIASNLVEADAMVSAIEAKNLKWAIGFNFRVLPLVEYVRKMVMEEGIIGEVMEVRGRGKEDKRAGGEDLIVLGTHIFDLMRHFLGNASWCTSNVTVNGRLATKGEVREATEPVGPILGDRIIASFGFDKGIVGHFASVNNRDGNGGRWGLDIFGSKGIVSVRQEPTPRARLLREPSWTPLESGAAWEALPGCPTGEMKNPELERYAPILDDLLASIGTDRLPRVSLQDGRASLEMIQAVYEAHLSGARVEFPLKDRTHPLARA